MSQFSSPRKRKGYTFIAISILLFVALLYGPDLLPSTGAEADLAYAPVYFAVIIIGLPSALIFLLRGIKLILTKK